MNGSSRAVREAARFVIAPLVAGRPVFLVGNAAESTKMADFLVAAGAVAVHHLPLPAAGEPLAERYAGFERLLAEPPEAIVQEVGTLDPTKSGVVYAGSFTAASTFCGRPVIGSRSSLAFAAERKDVQNQILGHSSQRVLIELSDLARAHDAVAGLTAVGPAVLQGIPHKLLAMGTSHTYGIPARAASTPLSHVLMAVASDCTTAVLAPLDEGIPCTYYGFVADDWVLDFGPFEALVYWDRSSWRLHAPGVVRPLPLEHNAVDGCHATVQAVARQLHRRTDYSGAFGTDGVVFGTRYSIHEINPRICAGFTLLDQLSPQPVPLAAVDLALRQDPRTAQDAVLGPLRTLAADLQAAQRPMIRLWDQKYRQTQADLSAAAESTDDTHDWLRLVRKRISTEYLVPVADLNSAGAEPCA